MGWRFRKSFKIFPGVRLNFGKKGVTGTTLGKRGFTTSIGKRGTFQNFGIRGTGLSYRNKVGRSGSVGGGILTLGVIGGVIVLVVGLHSLFSLGPKSGNGPKAPAPSKLAALALPIPSPPANGLASNKKRKKSEGGIITPFPAGKTSTTASTREDREAAATTSRLLETTRM
jgi:hypothetical protein